jgi:hypothetical protein
MLPAAFAHALESWALAILWQFGSGLEVRENTEKTSGTRRLKRNPVDRMWLNVRRSCAAMDSRLRGYDGYAGSNGVRVALAQQTVRCGSGPADTV